MRVAAALLALLTAAGVFAVSRFTRAGLEMPEYRVLEKEDAFEVREYLPMTVVSTPIDRELEMDDGFGRLFRYITGANEAEADIAMTAPVLTGPKLEQSAPTMSFVVPKEVVEHGAPAPTGAQVELSEIPGGTFAAYRFSGTWSPTRIEEAKQKLENWLERRDTASAGEPLVAFYDAPFTPSFLRRNEILIRLSSS